MSFTPNMLDGGGMKPRQSTVISWLKKLGIGLAIIIALFWGISAIGHAIGRVLILEFFMALTPHDPISGVNVLAFGIDETRAVKRSDTIMVFHLDANNNRIGVLSVPRDTYMKVADKGMTKVNHAYAFGGAKLLKESVSQFLGIPIHHYVQVNLSGIEALIDTVGGLSLTVEKDLQYEDKAGGLYIDLKAGAQTLTGKEAIQYLRFRQDNEGDIGRIRRQQTFLKALGKRVTSMGTLFELPKLLSQLDDAIKTDMNLKEMMGLSFRFREAYNNGVLEMGTVPGEIRLIDGLSYWKPELSSLDSLVTKLLNPEPIVPSINIVTTVETPDKAASEDKRRQVTPEEVTRVTEVVELNESDSLLNDAILVEVLNGMGKAGLAKVAARDLKDIGITVVRYDNAGSFNYAKTLLVDWKGNVETSLALANAIGLQPDEIILYDRPEKSIDFTIVIGADWQLFFKQW